MTQGPATPRAAATTILLRRGGRHSERGTEILLLRRGEGARFMPGVWVFPGGAVDSADREEAERRAVDGDSDPAPDELAHRICAVRELGEEAGIEIDDGGLVAWSRWITPEVVPVRFDTRFYVALAPAHSPPRPDGVEMTEARWLAPGAALELHGADELPLSFPTTKHLEALRPYETSEDVLTAARRRRVEPILPRVVGTAEEHRILLPGDPGYDD